ncbi:MAG: DUF692 family protein [Aggregatilineales bacterium]
MRFAMQYSPQAIALLESGQITIDLFKCPDWDDLIALASAHRPVYVHFPLMAGRGFDNVDWDKLERHLKQTGTRFVNMHLGPYTADFPDKTVHDDDPVWTEQLIERMLTDIVLVKNRFGAERVILENVPYDATPRYQIPRPVLKPDVIRRVVKESGCGLLLDTAHAHIAALYLGIDPLDYLSQLPGELMRELHITGVRYDDTPRSWEDHFELTADDWRLAEFTFDKIKSGEWSAPDIVAFEYGGVGEKFAWRSRPEVISHDAPRIYELMQSAQQELISS